MMKGLLLGAAGAVAMFGTAACADKPAGDEAKGKPVAAATATAPPASAAGDEADARAFVDQLFGAYAGEDASPDTFAEPGKTFEPDLAAAIEKLDARTERTGLIEASQDADPICDCQDFGEVSHSIDTLTIDGARAQAIVIFRNYGTTAKRRVELVKTPAGWRIFDIDGTYRKAVFDDLAQP